MDKIVTFETAVMECFQNKEFMKEYNRLNGTHLAQEDKRSPLDILIDDATGFTLSDKEKDDLRAFIAFVDVVVWQEVLNTAEIESKAYKTYLKVDDLQAIIQRDKKDV